LSIWDVVKQGWRKPTGQIGVTVGASSRDKRLTGVVPVWGFEKSRTGWIAFGVYICGSAWGWYLHPGEAQRGCCCPEPQLQGANASTKNCDTKIVCLCHGELAFSKWHHDWIWHLANNRRPLTYISTVALLEYRHSYWRPRKMPPAGQRSHFWSRDSAGLALDCLLSPFCSSNPSK